MAPVTRSSQYGARPAELQPSAAEVDDVPEDLHVSSTDDGDNGAGEDEISEEEEDPFAPRNPDYLPRSDFYSSTAQDLLQPLQQTAERVSKQVEEFAKCLDKFNTARDSSDQELWIDAWKVLDRYTAIALARKQRMSSSSPRSRSSSRNRRSLGDCEAELQNVQLEADLWALTKDLLVCNCPQARSDAEYAQSQRLSELHRYSRNSDIWGAFLDSDVVAQECETTLAWLQERAAASSVRVEDAIADLTLSSQRGETWSAGPIYTKNAIKAQKRSRVWSKPLEPSNPGIRSTHKRALDGIPLVTQLDPDAPTREDAALQPQDDFHEQAAWKACWEFLRRGSTQDTIRQYWSDRKESWRAMVLRLNDPFAIPQPPDQPVSPWPRIINLVSNSEWLDGCRRLCQDDDDLYDYQSAVYGLMCGDVSSSLKVCSTIDDNLFTMFNGMLISRYKSYIEAYRAKLSDSSSIAYQPPPSTLESIRQYLVLSQKDEKTREESRKPHMLLEGAIICKDFDNFFIQQGEAAAQVAHISQQSAHLMRKDDSHSAADIAQLAAQDPDSIRIVAHLQLLLRSLGYLRTAYETNLEAVENNIVSYIGWLQREGELELIPLYASKLSDRRIPFAVGPILIDIIDPKERELQIRLMKRYGMSIPDAIWGMWQLVNYAERKAFEEGRWKKVYGANITEYVGPNEVKNIRVRAEFMSEEMTEAEELAVRSAEWYRYIDAEQWGRACFSVTTLYKIFLLKGRLAPARELARRVGLSEISLAALGIDLHVADSSEVSDDGDMDMDGVTDEKVKSISPSRRKKEPKLFILYREGTSKGLLAAKASIWGQLEQLIVALDALERWTDFANEADSVRNNPAAMRNLKKELRAVLDEVRESMYPLLSADFLCKPQNAAEGITLRIIRNHYLPECILAYNSVLYFAGHSISRSWLVECMSLAQVVATTDSLTKAFVEGKRMREFVDAMAKSAQGMIGANEVGRKVKLGKSEKEREGELGLWSVKWPLNAASVGDLEALD